MFNFESKKIFCEICNIEFISYHPITKFCSDKCKKENKNKKRRKVIFPEIKCLYCNNNFTQLKSNLKFCSNKCSSKFNDNKRKIIRYCNECNNVIKNNNYKFCSTLCKRKNLNKKNKIHRNNIKYKEQQKKYHKEYRIKNKEILKIKKSAYEKLTRKQRKEKILKNKKIYRNKHKDKLSKDFKNWVKRNNQDKKCIDCLCDIPPTTATYCCDCRIIHMYSYGEKNEFLFKSKILYCASKLENKCLKYFIDNFSIKDIMRAEKLFKIPYFDEKYNKNRQYLPDFLIILDDGTEYLVEVKDNIRLVTTNWQKEYMREAPLKKIALFNFCYENNLVPFWYCPN